MSCRRPESAFEPELEVADTDFWVEAAVPHTSLILNKWFLSKWVDRPPHKNRVYSF